MLGCKMLECKLRVLRRIFGPKRDKVTREWRKLHMRSLMICTPHPILFAW